MDTTLKTAEAILLDLVSTSQLPEFIADRYAVPLAYVCGIFDGYHGGDDARYFIEVNELFDGLNYTAGQVRGEQLRHRDEAAEEAA